VICETHAPAKEKKTPFLSHLYIKTIMLPVSGQT
jgi:hypothetical protein